jgi:hypothetical protein
VSEEIQRAEAAETTRYIHSAATPEGVCPRKDAKVDARTTKQGQTTITFSGEAFHRGNVNCPVCKKYLRAARAVNGATK